MTINITLYDDESCFTCLQNHKKSTPCVPCLPTYSIVVVGNVVIPEFLHREAVERRASSQCREGLSGARQAYRHLGPGQGGLGRVSLHQEGVAQLRAQGISNYE